MNALAKAFELSSSAAALGRAEDAQAAGAKEVDRAGGERRLRADDGEVDLLGEREVGELGEIGDGDVPDVRLGRGAGVAGRDEDALHPRRLRQPPGQRVLAPAAADDERLQSAISAL